MTAVGHGSYFQQLLRDMNRVYQVPALHACMQQQLMPRQNRPSVTSDRAAGWVQQAAAQREREQRKPSPIDRHQRGSQCSALAETIIARADAQLGRKKIARGHCGLSVQIQPMMPQAAGRASVLSADIHVLSRMLAEIYHEQVY